MKIQRNYELTTVFWLNDNEFTAVAEKDVKWGHRNPDGSTDWQVNHVKDAIYGWSKGGSFFLYTIDQGHIQKLGTVKRMDLEVAFPPGVV